MGKTVLGILAGLAILLFSASSVWPIPNWLNHGANSIPTPVPEPATLLLLGTGLLGSAAFYRKRVGG
jgi:hypothetical protein